MIGDRGFSTYQQPLHRWSRQENYFSAQVLKNHEKLKIFEDKAASHNLKKLSSVKISADYLRSWEE